MAGPPTLQGPFRVPSFNPYIPRRLQPWIYLAFAFIFLMSSGIYGGAMSQVMGEYSLKREDVLMIVMCNVVGVNMPFPMLFRMKFRFTNRLYSFALRHQIADNLGRGLPYDMTGIMSISIRQLYGYTCFVAIGVLIVFLLWDVQPVRSTLKKMPTWNFVGRMMKKKEKKVANS